MKFLLVAINAKYIHSNPAIYSLRACAGEKLQKYVELAEYTINQQMGEILADIYRRKPDKIGFSCYIWNWRMVQDLLVEIPKLLPNAEIWLGGPEVSFECDKILQQYPQLAGIMVGEGEATFKELLEYYVKESFGSAAVAGGQEMVAAETESNCKRGMESDVVEEKGSVISNIPGLCLSSGYTAMRPLTDMSVMPFLYHDLQSFENKIIYYESSRGCPFRCSYCLSSIDKAVRLRDISVVKKELQFFLDNKVKQVKFVDRTFNCNHDHALAIWQYLLENDNDVTNFHFEISADILREDEIELLNRMRPGLVQLEIGVQSVNSETLHAIRRVMDVDKLEQIVAAIHRGKNVHQHLDLIAGLPYEDYASFRESFNRVYRMKPEQLQLGFLKVLRGSEMWERAAEYGICYQEQPPYEVLYTDWLSYEDVLRLKQIEEMVELYYNSGQFTHTIAVLEQAFASPFAMYEALAAFYEREGYFVNAPARAYRYQVLLAFAREFDGTREGLYREHLTYDMYLRENLKSRPDFAKELTPYKDTIRNFYQGQEELNRQRPNSVTKQTAEPYNNGKPAPEKEPCIVESDGKEVLNIGYLAHYGAYDWKQMSKMTHLEPFHYPVWDVEALSYENNLQQTADADGACTYILFDYSIRNPLTYQATTHIIEFSR